MITAITVRTAVAVLLLMGRGLFAHADSEVLVTSALAVDEVDGTVTLPLYRGVHRTGDIEQDVYYVVTDSSFRADAEARGVNYSPKLTNTVGSVSVQPVTLEDGIVVFPGTVDFSGESVVVPGPEGFPPEDSRPGSVGDARYSPLIDLDGSLVLNAPQVANATGVHDKVTSLDLVGMTVTLRLTEGRYHGKDILYLSTDASDPGAAALEESTYAPNLDAAPGIASNDPSTSARSSIVPVVNGPTGADNPERQGLQSALRGEGAPLNITIVHPRNRGETPEYSPIWDVHPAVWTETAIAAGTQMRLNHHEEVIDAVEAGFMVSGGEGPANPDLAGLRAAGFVVNCPVIVLR